MDRRGGLLHAESEEPVGVFYQPRQTEQGERLAIESVVDGMVGEGRVGSAAEKLRLQLAAGNESGQTKAVLHQALVVKAATSRVPLSVAIAPTPEVAAGPSLLG